MMMRFAPAAALAVAAAFSAGPVSAQTVSAQTVSAQTVSAQTVSDYEVALAAVPAAPPAAVTSACLPLQNYVYTAMEPGERKAPWLLSWLTFTPFAADAVADARRDCGGVREAAVIAFNQGSAEEIVTPPKLEDENSLVRPVDAMVSPPSGYDASGRRTPRVR